MGSTLGPRYTSIDQVKGPSGFYDIHTSQGAVCVYIDQEYDGGGWAMVMANRGLTAGMNNLKYFDAVNKSNYRTEPSGDDTTNTVHGVSLDLTKLGLSNVNTFIGLKFWFDLAQRETANKVTIVQFVSTSNGTALSATSSHTKRYRWAFDGWGSDYSFSNSYSISDETSSGSSPGFYNYHSKGSRGLTTFDNDQDDNSGNCSTYYNNNPFWYGSCWSGNYFGGGGYQDAAYWNSSTTDYHNYGAVYIK